MTRTQWRWLIAIFWIFVIGMLVRQFWQSDQQQQAEAEARPPTQQHFFFVPPPTPHALPSPPQPTPGPAVHQTRFVVHADTPGQGSFTCDVTLVNEGETIAHNVQIYVRPYRGVRQGVDVLGHSNYKLLPDDDPLSQYGVWITFPDLKPGEAVTESTVFLNHPNILPGFNPDPQIVFEAPKL